LLSLLLLLSLLSWLALLSLLLLLLFLSLLLLLLLLSLLWLLLSFYSNYYYKIKEGITKVHAFPNIFLKNQVNQ